jgi:uncharacterized protein (DUF3820 family)
MDKLEFKITKKEISGRETLSVNVFVNDKNLIDLLKEYELPFAKKEGHPDIAGTYSGMTPKDFLYWFIKADWPGENNHAIFECSSCGEVGCWPMIVSVSKEGNKVKWFNFNQPYRGPKLGESSWDYSDFPTFEFSVENYNAEFDKLTKFIS